MNVLKTELLKIEILDIWNKAVAYFNRICVIVEHLPKQEGANFPSLAQRSALLIPHHIAKSTVCSSEEEKKKSLDQAIESVVLTVSALELANQRTGLRKDLVREAYREGKLIVRRIKHVAKMSNLN